MNKKLLYLACVITADHPGGAAKKVISHCKVFSKFYNVTLISYDKSGLTLLANNDLSHIDIDKKHRKVALFQLAEKLSQKEVFDYIYIRYPRSDYMFMRLLSKFAHAHSKIVVEIPTYPYNLEKCQNRYIRELSLRAIDRYYRKRIYKYVDRIVTYSNDEYIWGIKTIKTINGVDFATVPMRNYTHHKSIVLTMCAIFADCHGCDRIIEGMNLYYASGGNRDIELHLVGRDDGFVIKKWERLVKNYNLENRVFFKGYLEGEALDSVYNITDIAVNSLAIHRLGLETESTLKSKEYVARGIPILTAYKVDALDDDSYKEFVLQLDLSDNAIDMNEIIKFLDQINRLGKPEIVSQRIREASRKICDMETTLMPVVNYFNNVMRTSNQVSK